MSSRPDVGTYGQYDFGSLPPVPFPTTGDLAWLATRPVPAEWSVGGGPVAALPGLLAACDRLGVPLPPAFVRFLSTPDLQRRIRSCTACFLDVSAEPVPAPGGDGHLIRFLADQQGCLYWYLYLTADGSDHAVLCSAELYGPSDDDDQDDEDDQDDGDGDGDGDRQAADLAFCSESFETFLCRYWLENEIWFAAADGTPMPEGAEEYIARYRTHSPA